MKPSELFARMDERQKGVDDKLEEILSEIKNIDGRVADVENWKAKVGGIATAVLLILGGAGTVTGLLIGVLSLLKHA